MDSHILLDLACLDRGLPPLSHSDAEVVEMILHSSRGERRRINRKIRKLCKTAMKYAATDHIWTPGVPVPAQNQYILRFLGLKQEKTEFSRLILMRRINYVRNYMSTTAVPAIDHN
jgi:hypothetical protein